MVCRSVRLVSLAETAEPIEMPFGLRTWIGPENHVLDRGPDPSRKGAILRGKRHPIVKHRNTVQSSVQKRLDQSRCRLGCGLRWAQGIVLDGGPGRPWERVILWGKGVARCEV